MAKAEVVDLDDATSSSNGEDKAPVKEESLEDLCSLLSQQVSVLKKENRGGLNESQNPIIWLNPVNLRPCLWQMSSSNFLESNPGKGPSIFDCPDAIFADIDLDALMEGDN